MVTSETLASIIESIVFVSGNSITIKDIAEKLGVTEKTVLEEAKKLQKKYDENSGINLLIFNKKLQFCSNPKNAEDVAVVLNPIRERELSRSMLEVAAIIAYKQPVTRLDLEQIRGVDSEYAIQNLLKMGVIEVVGRKDAIGRPVLFGTTDVFLKRFQISSLDELPDYEQLLASIQVKKTDSFLFKKDVYDASTDPELIEQAQVAQAAEPNGENGTYATDLGQMAEKNEPNSNDDDGAAEQADSVIEDDDFELGDIEDEELPEHLRGEKIIKID